MYKLNLRKDSDCYRFHSKAGGIGNRWIHEIDIYVFDISLNRRTETRAGTYNLKRYKKYWRKNYD